MGRPPIVVNAIILENLLEIGDGVYTLDNNITEAGFEMENVDARYIDGPCWAPTMYEVSARPKLAPGETPVGAPDI